MAVEPVLLPKPVATLGTAPTRVELASPPRRVAPTRIATRPASVSAPAHPAEKRATRSAAGGNEARSRRESRGVFDRLRLGWLRDIFVVKNGQ
jgi:hypothetical protein